MTPDAGGPDQHEGQDDLRRGVLSFEPRTEAEDDLYAQALDLVGELDENRALRLLEVCEGIPYSGSC